MSPTPAGAVTLDVCEGCGATWFDARELGASRGGDDRLEPALRASAHARITCRVCAVAVDDPAEACVRHCEQVLRAPCPRCGAILSCADAGPLDLDLCLFCGGLFLAPPALARLAELTAPAPPPVDLHRLHVPFDPSAMPQILSSAYADWMFEVL